MKFFFSLLTISCVVVSIASAQTNTGWHVKRSIHIGGRGRWDYLAIYNGKLYVSHDSLVNVVNEVSGDSISTIPGTYGVHGIAFAPGFGKGFITAGRTSEVVVFD